MTTAAELGQGYAIDGPAPELGTVVLEGTAYPDARVRLPLSMLTRHGLVAGATGTGKTKTLQLMAEQMSTAGIPVFLADVKGDVSGVAAPGVASDRITERATDTGTDWVPTAFPAEFLALGGLGSGVPVRATMTSFGPVLLSKLLGLNETQESSLGLVFHFADKVGLPLLDLKDLRAVIGYLVSDEGKADLTGLGGLSAATAAVTILSERGAPTPVAWTRMRPPTSLMAPLDPAAQTAMVQSSPLLAEYGQSIDRDSAYEPLLAKVAPPELAPASDRETPRQQVEPEREGAIAKVLGSSAFRSLARSAASAAGREITRSLFGTASRRRRRTRAW